MEKKSRTAIIKLKQRIIYCNKYLTSVEKQRVQRKNDDSCEG